MKTNKRRISVLRSVLLMFVMLVMSAQAVYAARNATNYEPVKGPYRGRNGEYKTGDDPLTSIQLELPEVEKRINIFEILFGVDKVRNNAVEGVTYDVSTNTLTLRNFRRPDARLYATMMGDDFTLRVVGTCSLRAIDVSTSDYFGDQGERLHWGGSLNIKGTGTLTVNKTTRNEEPWGITLWADGADAKLNISKTVSLNVYGDGYFNAETNEVELERTAIFICRSAGFYDTKVILLDGKPIQQVNSKYQMGGFMDEAEPTLKDYWVKAQEVSIKGLGRVDVGNSTVALSEKTFVYNRKVQKPKVKTIGRSKVTEGIDYRVKWSDESSKNAGTYTMTVIGKGDYKGSKVLTYKIKKADNPLQVKGRTATLRYSRLKNDPQTLDADKVLNIVEKGKGKMSYVKFSGNKKITINKKTGLVTVEKGLKKGTYNVRVQVKAAGNDNYKASEVKTVAFKITVK